MTPEQAAQRLRDAVMDNTFGQDGESLYFVVKVRGIGARPESPKKIAETLAAEWSLTPVEWPVAVTPSVMVPDSREYATALDDYAAFVRVCAVAETAIQMTCLNINSREFKVTCPNANDRRTCVRCGRLTEAEAERDAMIRALEAE